MKSIEDDLHFFLLKHIEEKLELLSRETEKVDVVYGESEKFSFLRYNDEQAAKCYQKIYLSSSWNVRLIELRFTSL